MKNLKKILVVLSILSASFVCFGAVNPDAKLHKFSTTIEKERPKLNDETVRLIAAYRKNPTAANKAALKKQVEKNYDNVIARKKAKLEDLKKTAKDASKVREMEDIVAEMLANRDARVAQTMIRFTDPRLRPGVREKAADGFLPVLGAAQNVSIAYTPVTNAQYAEFLKATGKSSKLKVSAENADCPVVNVSYNDATAYCKWLTQKDGKAKYRLPTELEWVLAAGHMPKDADFNCGEDRKITPVNKYAKTLSACGAIDMWGNCWEWTSGKASSGGSQMLVKGGAFDSKRTQCRTEQKEEGRNPNKGYNNVGFRVVRVK